MRALISMLGFPDLPTMQLVILVSLAFAAAVMLGWLADSIIGDGGFGLFGNGVLMLAGAIGGAILWRKTGYSFGSSKGLATAIIAGASATLSLILAGTAKRLL